LATSSICAACVSFDDTGDAVATGPATGGGVFGAGLAVAVFDPGAPAAPVVVGVEGAAGFTGVGIGAGAATAGGGGFGVVASGGAGEIGTGAEAVAASTAGVDGGVAAAAV
jgi:hypothetical protein